MVIGYSGPTGNRILDALPPDVRARVVGMLTRDELRARHVLWEPGSPIEAVHFPVSGIASLVTPVSDGGVVEVATVGNEGIVGVPAVLGGGIATVRALVQVAGRSLSMPAHAFHEEMQRGGPFSRLVQCYIPALFSQVAQTAACNRLHSNEERLSRWLLMSHDRVGGASFAITQEFLGQMLGSRRATVTVSAGVLQRAGLISYHRGEVTILDREGLEAISCECYAVIRNALDRCMAPVTTAVSPGSGRGAAPTPG